VSSFIDKLIRSFTTHPQSVDKTYWQHLRHAVAVAYRLEKLGWILFIHAIFPFLFTNTTSRKLLELGKQLRNDDD